MRRPALTNPARDARRTRPAVRRSGEGAPRAGDVSPRSRRRTATADANPIRKRQSPESAPSAGQLPGLTSWARAAARRGFTLVEMLVVIVIIGILAALAMAGLFASQEAARRTRTEGFIGQLNNHLAYRWETYRTRRLPVTNSYADASIEGTYAYDVRQYKIDMGMDPDDPTSFIDNQRAAAMQLIARRQLMRIELPDRWYDVAFDDDTWVPPVPSPSTTEKFSGIDFDTAYDGQLGPAEDSTGSIVQRNLANWPQVDRKGINYINRTSLSNAYKRRYQQVIQQRGEIPSRQFQGAECLYMILTTGMGDETTGGGAFNQRDFADVDDDGMPEFVDGWGRPIAFLRWAPGFRSDMQTGDPINDHDPFDPRKVDTIAFRLFPLIYSAGPDGINDDGVNTPHGINNHSFDAPSPPTHINFNDPYAPAPTDTTPGVYYFRGTPLEERAGIGPNDNIFNQSLLVR